MQRHNLMGIHHSVPSREGVPGILGSVVSLEEAEILMQAPVDIVDIKDPRQGILGALERPRALQIARRAMRCCRVSATVGDVSADDSGLPGMIRSTYAIGVDYVKVGLFQASLPESFLISLRACAGSIPIVVVLFAELYLPVKERVFQLLDCGIAGLMLDTCMKGERRLPEILDAAVLEDFLAQVRGRGLLAGLAGSLRLEDLDEPILRQADYLGFRGALCAHGERGGTVSVERVAKLCAAVRRV
ncbi:MAG: (5-formylfuran-3-yl)methyl phosphate synthase [Candidatus Eutrophobiaceae bacterium]